MSMSKYLAMLSGEWAGEKQLWLSPDSPAKLSRSSAAVVIGTKLTTLAYTWSADDVPQEGVLLLNINFEQKTVSAAWMDTWHMGDGTMICRGVIGVDGVIVLDGSYAVPSGPDWGWRITIRPEGEGKFSFLMDNISPDGEAGRAVEIVYTRNGMA